MSLKVTFGGFDVNTSDYDDRTALHVAAAKVIGNTGACLDTSCSYEMCSGVLYLLECFSTFV